MKTLKELQAEIEKLQKEEETLTTLCGFIPEKLAVYFKHTYLRSGYSMGEEIVYTCNGKELLVIDNREYYTGRGRKYTPTHGYIKVDFTKKALKAYCSLLKDECNNDYYNKLRRAEFFNAQKELDFKKHHKMDTQEIENKVKLLSERINARNNEGVKLEGEKKALLLSCINHKESKIKELIY
jgi:hypothetical protein